MGYVSLETRCHVLTAGPLVNYPVGRVAGDTTLVLSVLFISTVFLIFHRCEECVWQPVGSEHRGLSISLCLACTSPGYTKTRSSNHQLREWAASTKLAFM